MNAMICTFAAMGSASHCSGGDKSVDGMGVPAEVNAQGKTKLDCTQYPTNAAMAIRPCLISDCRSQPMVRSWLNPQNPASTKSSGSQKPTTGLSSLARVSRSAYQMKGNRNKHNMRSSNSKDVRFLGWYFLPFSRVGNG